MLSQRPFKDSAEVFASAERIWRDLQRSDWLEAFRAHPRIGENDARDARSARDAQDAPRTRGWAAAEQAGMKAATDDVRGEIARANREYEATFGWLYLVCATGKSPEQLLALCRARMANAPDVELAVAAEEQLKITRLRLEKLLDA